MNENSYLEKDGRLFLIVLFCREDSRNFDAFIFNIPAFSD